MFDEKLTTPMCSVFYRHIDSVDEKNWKMKRGLSQ